MDRRASTVVIALTAAGMLTSALAQPTSKGERLGWKEHFIKQGDGKGGWIIKPARYQVLHHPQGGWSPAFGLAQMDNGEIILVGSWEPEGQQGATYVAFSKDRGATWTELQNIPGLSGRPVELAYLGGGDLCFELQERWFSHDYGRTWTEHVPIPPAPNGLPFWTEGNPWVDRDANGKATRMCQIGFNYKQGDWPTKPLSGFFRWSPDGGRTFTDEVNPQEWLWEDTYKGHKYLRGGGEGSVVRARNGWLVATIRTDIPARYLEHTDNDNLCGTAVTISRDDGRTWSPLQRLFEAGRHHANLLLMPNGDIVMTMTVRVDVRDGKLASYRRGCDALVSHDNGLTWNLDRRYELDSFEYYDGKEWYNGQCGHLCSTLLDDGSILTCHNNYWMKGVSLIRWRP